MPASTQVREPGTQAWGTQLPLAQRSPDAQGVAVLASPSGLQTLTEVAVAHEVAPGEHTRSTQRPLLQLCVAPQGVSS